MKITTIDKGKSGIYVIQNRINNKVYVGKSINIYKRMIDHRSRLNNKNKDENIHLIRAWHKYGKDNFYYYVIEYTELDQDLLSVREIHWIKKLNALSRNNGYNLKLDSSTRMIVSDETRKRCSEAQLKRYKDPEEKRKSSERSISFWKNNPDIKEQMRKSLSKAKRKYRVAKCDKTTNEILHIYGGIDDVRQSHPDYYLQAIKGCCGGNKSSYKGFKWCYINMQNDKRIIK
jgi:group I intron endonuclease